jgi:hypothetical protein
MFAISEMLHSAVNERGTHRAIVGRPKDFELCPATTCPHRERHHCKHQATDAEDSAQTTGEQHTGGHSPLATNSTTPSAFLLHMQAAHRLYAIGRQPLIFSYDKIFKRISCVPI